MGILSIQSHVAYGYVGNKAAVYPLQSMGYDVWPVNTVQFSNHTGYKKWKGEVFSKNHIRDVINGLEDIGAVSQCKGILSGYMGSAEICFEVLEAVHRFKAHNKNILYLCDPVIGDNTCYVKPEVLEFFKTNLKADIITPNQYEAEVLSGLKINNPEDMKAVAEYFHKIGIKIVVITGLEFASSLPNKLSIFVSDAKACYLVETNKYKFEVDIKGTGDLFSAIFLGSYISSQSAKTALQTSVYYIDKVLSITLKENLKELQVTKLDYKKVLPEELPKIVII